MSRMLLVDRIGPSVTVQDLGREGFLSVGLSRGGAADRTALCEAAALLGETKPQAVLELAGYGGIFRVTAPTRFSLSGAPMNAAIDGKTIQWSASHLLLAGQRLEIGAAVAGVYGYLGFAGGLDVPEILGSRATHLTGGIGKPIAVGDTLPIGADHAPDVPSMVLRQQDRFQGGTVRFVDNPQSALFDAETTDLFERTEFTRDAAGNRQGVRLNSDIGSFATAAQLAILSDAIQPGDIQMTGEGIPYVLLPECQTIGGYPRIGTVVPQDLPIVAQAPVGARLRFKRVSLQSAVSGYTAPEAMIKELRATCRPLVRDPATMNDLLSYQLISGAITGWEDG